MDSGEPGSARTLQGAVVQGRIVRAHAVQTDIGELVWDPVELGQDSGLPHANGVTALGRPEWHKPGRGNREEEDEAEQTWVQHGGEPKYRLTD